MLWILFKCLPSEPRWVYRAGQKGHSKGLMPVCTLKWSFKLHDLLKLLEQPLNLHLYYNLYRFDSMFLTFYTVYHSSGIPLKKTLRLLWTYDRTLLQDSTSSCERSYCSLKSDVLKIFSKSLTYRLLSSLILFNGYSWIYSATASLLDTTLLDTIF